MIPGSISPPLLLGFPAAPTIVAAYSTDETTWLATTMPETLNGLVDIEWCGTRFIGVDGFAGLSGRSTDGIVWTQSGTISWSDPGTAGVFAWNGTVACAVCTNGETATSTDGTSWAVHTGIVGAHEISAISAIGSTFCAIGSLNPGADFRSWTSTDGITWNEHSLSIQMPRPYGLCSTGSKLCFISLSDLTCATSTDGASWTTGTIPSFGNNRSVATNGSGFVAVTTSATTSLKSTDGLTWTSGGAISESCFDITYGGSLYLALGSGINVSSDGTSWANHVLPDGGGLSPNGLASNGSSVSVVSYF